MLSDVCPWCLSLWVLIRELWRPLSHPLSDRWLAQRLERKDPRTGWSTNASTVEFSAEHYHAALRLSISATPKCRITAIRKLVDSRSSACRRSDVPSALRTYLATISLRDTGLRSSVMMIFPAHALTALQRLGLALATDRVAARGDPAIRNLSRRRTRSKKMIFDTQLFPRGTDIWNFYVTNLRGDLPEDLVASHSRCSAGETRRQALPRISGKRLSNRLPGDKSSCHSRTLLSFAFRGVTTLIFPWMPVEVVPLPRCSLTCKMELIPPAYSAREPEQIISAGSSFVQALIGSQLLESPGSANMSLWEASELSATSDSDSSSTARSRAEARLSFPGSCQSTSSQAASSIACS